MNVDEIFTKITNHMLYGALYHKEISKTYDFLGLYRYMKFHMNQSIEEMREYLNVVHYYSSYYHKLLVSDAIEQFTIIPNNWYKYNSFVLDNATRKSAIKDLMNKWISWEQETKILYQKSYKELYDEGEIAAAIEIARLIKEVSEELKGAERELIELEAIGYDLPTIISEGGDFNDTANCT